MSTASPLQGPAQRQGHLGQGGTGSFGPAPAHWGHPSIGSGQARVGDDTVTMGWGKGRGAAPTCVDEFVRLHRVPLAEGLPTQLAHEVLNPCRERPLSAAASCAF